MGDIRLLQEIVDWIKGEYRPTHFISIQMPFEAKTTDIEAFTKGLHYLLRRAQRELLGRYWVSKHYRFIIAFENGRSGNWHAHMLFSCPDRTIYEIRNAFDKAGTDYRKQRRTRDIPNIDIRPITNNLNRVVKYCTKEAVLGQHGRFSSERIDMSENMFNHRSGR